MPYSFIKKASAGRERRRPRLQRRLHLPKPPRPKRNPHQRQMIQTAVLASLRHNHVKILVGRPVVHKRNQRRSVALQRRVQRQQQLGGNESQWVMTVKSYPLMMTLIYLR